MGGAAPDGVVEDLYGPEDTVLSGPAAHRGTDRPLEVAGPGAPTVSELALVEYAAVLGMTSDAGRRYLGDALELAHRLPAVYARVLAGDLPIWRARRVAQATRDLCPAAAGCVDARVAPVAHRVGYVSLERLVEEARARFDPEEAELRALEAAETRHATIHPPTPGHELHGHGELTATLDLPDALDLDAALSALAAALRNAGSEDPLDVRRARAVGLLARGEHPRASDSHSSPDPDPGSDSLPGRAVTLYVHATAESLTTGQRTDPVGGVDLARVENTGGPVHADTVRAWLARPGTRITIKPVIDLRDQVAVDAYEVPDRIAERVHLARPTCAFPHCPRPSRSSDMDHVTAYVPTDRGGPPGQTGTRSLAPLCRRHHRAKTHAAPTDDPAGRRWRYRRDPDAFLWTSPHGHRFRVDPTGTVCLTRPAPVT